MGGLVLGDVEASREDVEEIAAEMALREEIRDEIVSRHVVSALPRFEGAEFEATIDGGRITKAGELQLNLLVPASEKYRAIALTDAVGLNVIIRASRKRPTKERTA